MLQVCINSASSLPQVGFKYASRIIQHDFSLGKIGEDGRGYVRLGDGRICVVSLDNVGAGWVMFGDYASSMLQVCFKNASSMLQLCFNNT